MTALELPEIRDWKANGKCLVYVKKSGNHIHFYDNTGKPGKLLSVVIFQDL